MADQKVEAAPTTEQTLRDKYNISDPPEGQEPEEGEHAPESDRDEPPQERKPLTDEEKADRKRRNDERRERRWYEERGEMRAEQRRLQERIAELENSRTRETPNERTPDEPDFERILDTHLKGGKHKTYEAALAAANKEYVDAREVRFRRSFEQENTTKTAERQISETRNAFDKDVREFSRTHEDFDDVYADLAGALDTRDKDGKPIGNAVTRAILTSKNGAALAYHIGSNPELLDEIQGLLADGDEEAARDRVIEIRASLKKAPPAQPQERTTTGAGRGKSTTHIAGRGGGGRSKDDLRAHASEKQDFTAFSAANGSNRKW